ncbi:MAG: ribonuclease Y [Ignavibacteria bacterium]|jgi:ribonuclease Y|nr:ribonuclease Y [Ignavibacteria bacterium]MDH7528770.1 ribonuclease Y [Ignavibacteria bacterium]NPV10268.1 ribonuclease Y [Ignavibacteria bacterium]
MELYILIPLIVIFSVALFFIGWTLNSQVGKQSIASAEKQAKKIIEEAEREANNIKREKLLEVKDEWFKKKQAFEQEVTNKKNNLQNYERQLKIREEAIDKKTELLEKKEKQIQDLEAKLNEKISEYEQKTQQLNALIEEQTHRLEKIAGLTQDEAKKMLVENLINEAKTEAAQMIKQIRDEAKAEAKKEARNIIVQAIQRSAADHSVETTVSVIQIQNEEMKGRIIGKEGRNIRAFEAATGVDVIVDDTPEAVILSAFDPFRREVAKVALERLIADGRIHPARIEEVVEKVKIDLEDQIIEDGENTLIELGIHGMHPELVRLIGKMKYRQSYGQNLLVHSKETAILAGIMAAELGLDPVLAKRGAILHDIGKVLDRNTEGPHALIGAEIAKKYNEHPIVVNAIASHHEDVEMEHPIAAIVQAADAISGARPGARREPLETYIKRLEKLEALAKSFEGVAKTYAIQAGREVRVVVEHEKIDDLNAEKLAQEIAARIQEEMEFPGQIKVVVIREVRKIAFAK